MRFVVGVVGIVLVCGAAVSVAPGPSSDERALEETSFTKTRRGTEGPDRLYGGPGPDTLYGDAGADRLYGGPGRDTLHGDAGADLLVGGGGRDRLFGGPGNDRIFARDGVRDVIDCGPGRDVARADRSDKVTRCETVALPRPPPPVSGEPLPGTKISVTEGQWRCTQPLRNYGTPPILVEHRAVNATFTAAAAVLLSDGCRGDGNPATIDLILHIEGNGADIGSSADAVNVGRASDVNVTGYAECGRPAPRAHQDGVQVAGGERITFENFRIGDLTTRRYSCTGAGGMWFISGDPRVPGDYPTDVVCIRCRMVSMHPQFSQTFRVEHSLRSGARESTFVGPLPCRVNLTRTATNPVHVQNICIRTGR